MNTILPKFVDFNNKTAFYKTNGPYAEPSFIIVLSLGLLIAFLCSIALAEIHDDNNKLKKYIKTHNLNLKFLKSILWLLICVCAVAVGRTIYNVREADINRNRYYVRGFRITSTNLMASKYQVKPTDDSDEILSNLDPYKNYHLAKYHVYVDLINAKPKGIHSKFVINQTPVDVPMIQTIYGGWIGGPNIDNDNFYNIVYLGYMKNGKFMPNYGNAKVTKIFMDYQDYIKRHHLESKFKHHFSFEVSHDYTTKDHNPVLVVVGDNDFTLHYKTSEITKDSDIVASEGS